MKKLILIMVFTSIIGGTYAQNDSTYHWSGKKKKEKKEKDDWEPVSLFGNKTTSNGGFVALMVQYSEFGDKEALMVGARGGWIMTHGFSIGLGGRFFCCPAVLGPIKSARL